MKSALLAVAGVALVAAVLYWATLAQSGVRCEACMVYGGQRYCANVSAATREQAEAGAVMNACSVLSSGVTRGLECQRTPPVSLDCSE